jgi:hypothetical protein
MYKYKHIYIYMGEAIGETQASWTRSRQLEI